MKIFTALLFFSFTASVKAECETAYAFCSPQASTCFLNDPRLPAGETADNAKRWGWTNQILSPFPSQPPLTCTIWAGAGQCKTENAINAGTATINPTTFQITMNPGYYIEALHFYHGVNPYPTQDGAYTIANGQFTPGYTYPPNQFSWDIFNGPLPMVVGDHFILHLSVCPGVSHGCRNH
jgi:hypothetical protein